MSMERNKSTRQTQGQGQLIKQVLAEFDIETQVNKIAVRCFNDLLRQQLIQRHRNKQAFEFIAETSQKLNQFETRLCKSEGFAESIETSLSNKIEIATNLNRRLETFNTQFYTKIKQTENTLQFMRKDFDNLISSTQKNTYELRNIGDAFQKNVNKIQSLEQNTAKQLEMMQIKIGQYQLNGEKQFIERISVVIEKQCQNLLSRLTSIRTEFSAKGANFEEVSNNIALYKHDKQSINNSLADILKEVQSKLPKSQFTQMRLYFDSQLTTQKEKTSQRFAEAKNSLKIQSQQRKSQMKNYQSESRLKWEHQNQINEKVENRVSDLKGEILSKIENINSKIQVLQLSLRTQLQALTKKEDLDHQQMAVQLRLLSQKIKELSTKTSDNQKFMQQRYDEMIELKSDFTSMNGLVNSIRQVNERHAKQLEEVHQMQKVQQMHQNQTMSKGQSVENMSGLIKILNQKIQQNTKMIDQLSKNMGNLTKNSISLEQTINEEQSKLSKAFNLEKTQNQSRITEINRRINDVSIEIMNNLQKVQRQSKEYSDTIISKIQDKLQYLEVISQQIKELKKAFEEQMLETQAVNRSISDKMEKTTASIIKFKSDMSLRIDGITNQQQRRSLELKQVSKLVQQIRKQLGFIFQTIQITLSIIINRQYIEQAESIKDVIKMSSLLEGWVLQIDEKLGKYRGEFLHRRKLAQICLNFIILTGDKIKGGLIESGKDIYTRMIEQSQQIFTARKKGISKRAGSQLPKLYY